LTPMFGGLECRLRAGIGLLFSLSNLGRRARLRRARGVQEGEEKQTRIQLPILPQAGHSSFQSVPVFLF